MGTLALLVLVAGAGSIVAWLFHRRSSHFTAQALERLAIETGGRLQRASFLLPKLLFRHDGEPVEVSAASTGLAGGSQSYTYVWFREFDARGLEFRILPRSIQSSLDAKLGVRRPIQTGRPALDSCFTVSASDPDTLRTVLTPGIEQDLLGWARQEPRNGIADIRSSAEGFLFCVQGILGDPAEYRRLVDSAIAFRDSLRGALDRNDPEPTSTSPEDEPG